MATTPTEPSNVPMVARIKGLTPGLPSYRPRGGGLTAFTLYLAVALLWDRATVAHMASACPCEAAWDAAQVPWTLEWFPHALLHGLNLIYTNAIWAPEGVNLAGVTAPVLPSFVMAPITYLWGPIVAYNVVTIVSPALTSFSCYWLCRYITKARWASILAGTTYGFGTYEITKLAGDEHMFLIFCPPLAALCILRLIDGHPRRWAMTAALTLVLLAQMFISPEVFFTMAVLVAVALLLAMALGRADIRRRIRATLPLVAVAYAITALLSSWYVIDLLQAPAYATNVGPNSYPTDLLAFIVPSPITWLGGATFLHVTSRFAGATVETAAYLGLPLLIIIGHFVYTRRKQRLTWFLAVMLIATALWVLAHPLFILGKPSSIWMPFALVQHLPGFDQAWPDRIGAYVELLGAVILALWVSSPTKRAVVRWSAALLAMACVLPNLIHPSNYNSSTWTNPAFFKTKMYRRYIRSGEIILPITWGVKSESTVWQAEDHMYYKIAGVNFNLVLPASWDTQTGDDLRSDTPAADDGPGLKALIIAHHVGALVVQQSEASHWRAPVRGTGLRPTATVGGVTIYDIPASWYHPASH